MGVDRYSPCPKCVADFHVALRLHEAELEAAYGKVPAAEYEILKAKIPTIPEETLDEVWSIGVSLPATFNIIYECWCKACHFTFTFGHSEQMKW